jgi:hypothetical protein
MIITFLVGLPASGKTFLGNTMKDIFNIPFIDDISMPGQLDLFEDNLKLGKDIIVADVFLCLEIERLKATNYVHKFMQKLNMEFTIEWIYFENNIEKCLKNVKNRADGRAVEGLIRHLTKEYKIPENIKAKEIWTNDKTL